MTDQHASNQFRRAGDHKQEATGYRGFFALALWLMATGLGAGFWLRPDLQAQTASKSTPKSPATATNQAKSPAKKPAARPAASSAARKRPAARPAAKKRTATRRTAPARRKAAAVPVRRQLRPTAERYAEIQSALAKAGYFQGSANGVWGQSSVDALAQFQSDNGLEPTGRIDALSLIKLDLGPKYDHPPRAAVSEE